MQIKVLCGCLTWKAIWCGLKRTLLPLVTFNSTVKKWPLTVQPNRSGVPCKLEFSSLIQEISGIDFLIFAYNFRSGFKVTSAFYSGLLGAIIILLSAGFNTTRIDCCPIIFDSCTSILLISSRCPPTCM